MASYLPLNQGQIAFVFKIYPELDGMKGFSQISSKISYTVLYETPVNHL